MPSLPSTTGGFTPASLTAFDELLATWRECVELTSATAADEHDSADGYRWATHFLMSAIGMYFENDPERPRFAPLIAPQLGRPWSAYSTPIEIWAPNPYTVYDWAPLLPGRRYRIRGTRGAVRYVSFVLYSGTEWNGLMPPRIGDWINMTNLVCEADGSFEIVIAAERPTDVKCTNFLEADHDVQSILVRQFFADPDEEPARYLIEPLDPVGLAPRHTDESTERRLRSLIAFLRQTGVEFLRKYGAATTRTSSVINSFDLASLDDKRSGTGRAVRGGTGFMYINPDHWYLFCRFELADDEALVIDLEPPNCHWWGLYGYDRYGQPFPYVAGARNLVNIGNAVPDKGGAVQIVVSAHDVGAANWIDTGGRTEGTLVIRWTITGIDPTENPAVPVPSTRVEPVASLRRRRTSNRSSQCCGIGTISQMSAPSVTAGRTA